MQQFVKTFATPYDLSGPCPTASLATLWQGLKINDERGDAIRDRLWALTQRVITGLHGLGFEVDNRSGFPIVSVRIGDQALLEDSARLLFDAGILVTVCPFPMVRPGEEVHRITVTAANTDGEVDQLLSAFAMVREQMSAARPA
jgi:8-amino-7-oxononanoate synthase